MAQDEASGESSVAVAERGHGEQAEAKPKRGWFGRRKHKDEAEEVEHELELLTPFGKLDLEFEPTSKKAERDRKKHEKAEREAAQAAKREAGDAKKRGKGAVTTVLEKRGGGHGTLLTVLVAIGLIAAAVGVAVWLFARKPEDLASVPPEYRVPGAEPEPEPQGFVAKARRRLTGAVRAGRQASREAQVEQQQRYEDLTRGA
ncbi:MAG: hypothetical protein ACYDEB_00630 [Dehalococcoidia bacterium]